jgi:hypothetical protein
MTALQSPWCDDLSRAAPYSAFEEFGCGCRARHFLVEIWGEKRVLFDQGTGGRR